jgi:metal transporter CNNM
VLPVLLFPCGKAGAETSEKAFLSRTSGEPFEHELLRLREEVRRLQHIVDKADSKCPSCISESASSLQDAEMRRLDEADGSMSFPIWISLPAIIFLVCLSGLFSGLTLGLMGLDLNALEAIENGDNETLKACAARIRPVRAKGNMLLCTLLLGNVAVNSALSILMASLDFLGGFGGFLGSTAVIVIFGEIIPQAACAKYALHVGARSVNIVWCMMMVMSFVTYPMSLLLDSILGKDLGQVYSSSELAEMVKLQLEKGAQNEADGRMAKQVFEGALAFRNKTVKDVMTKLESAHQLHEEVILDYETVSEIFMSGFSRIPVYGENLHDHKGLLYTKDLILYDPEDQMCLKDFIGHFKREALQITMDITLPNVLKQFQSGRAHLAIVRDIDFKTNQLNPRTEIVGVVTLEDVVEEIIQEEIVDECDQFEDVERKKKVSDGRGERQYNLGAFNPRWSKSNVAELEREEGEAIAAHLQRRLFVPESKDLCLSYNAILWLVYSSKVSNSDRMNSDAFTPSAEDYLYRDGEVSSTCTLILQGRFTVQTGCDGFRSEVGAFMLLGKNALLNKPGFYITDFSAWVSTKRVRYLSITRETFMRARSMSPDQLVAEIAKLRSDLVGCDRDESPTFRRGLNPRSLWSPRNSGQDAAKLEQILLEIDTCCDSGFSREYTQNSECIENPVALRAADDAFSLV